MFQKTFLIHLNLDRSNQHLHSISWIKVSIKRQQNTKLQIVSEEKEIYETYSLFIYIWEWWKWEDFRIPESDTSQNRQGRS